MITPTSTLLTVPVTEAGQPDTPADVVRLFYRHRLMPVYVTHGGLGDQRDQQVYAFCREIGEADGSSILIYELHRGPEDPQYEHLYLGQIFRYIIGLGLEPEPITGMAWMPIDPTSYQNELMDLSGLTSYALGMLRVRRSLTVEDVVETAITNAAMAGILDWRQLAWEMRANRITDQRLRRGIVAARIDQVPDIKSPVEITKSNGFPADSRILTALRTTLVVIVRDHL